MLLGIWVNFEDLEANINLQELEAILAAARKREYNRNKFAAALKGVDLDDDGGDKEKLSPKDRVEEMKERIAQKQSGKTEAQLANDALADLGLDFDTD